MDNRRPDRRRIPIRRVLVAVAGVTLVWAVAVRLSGGFFLRFGPLVVSSRRSASALLFAFVCAGAAVALTIARGRDAARADWQRYSPGVAALARAAAGFAKRHAMLVPLAIVLVVAVQSAGRWATPRPLWLDEESTLINVRDRTFTALSGTLWLGQSAPVGWMAIERSMLLAAGDGDRSLRLFPVLFSIGSCGLAYAIGRRWMNVLGATVFVWCCAFGQWFAHNRFEAKPYSADAFTALLLPALAAWVVDARTARDRYRRAILWWLTAAATIWLANGALMVAPGCVLILLGVIWTRDGLRRAAAAALWGGLWLGSFGLYYALSLRFTLGNTYLYDYWTIAVHGFPEVGAPLSARLAWLGHQFKELGDNPGGTTLWLTLWLGALGGVVFSRRRLLALLAAAPPLTAFVLGITHIVPLHDRVSFWMMPSVFLAVALLADRAGDWIASGGRRRAWLPVASALVVMVPIGYLCQDIFGRRDHDTPPTDRAPLNHALDDRHAVAYLLANRQPGDAVLTTPLTWASIWWYGRMSIADGMPAAEGHFADGGIELEASLDDSGYSCRHGAAVADRLTGVRRLLVYFGFQDQTDAFEPALEAQLKRLGTLRDEQTFGEGTVLIVDPHVPAERPPTPAGERCLAAGTATRW